MVIPPPSTGPRWKRAAIIAGAAAAAAALFCVCGVVATSVMNADVNEVGTPAPAVTTAGAVASAPIAVATTQPKVGDTVPVSTAGNGVDYTVLKTETAAADDFGSAASAGIYLLAEIKVAVREGEIIDSAFQWTFVGKTGTVYQATFMPVNKRKAYSGGSLGAGQQATGWLVFDIPKDEATGGAVQLELMEIFGDNQRITWKL